MGATTLTDTVNQFREALAAYDLNPPEIVADGQFHRFDLTDEKRGKKSGWYKLHDDGIAAGSFGEWKTGLSETWCGKSPSDMTPVERQQHTERIQQAKEQSERELLAAG